MRSCLTGALLIDHLGTVRDLVTQDGTVATHFQYDSFGRIVSGDTSLTRYLFTSREYDADTGLQYNRARWYDPATGRWISEDPLGFAAGDANTARYVGNRVMEGVDPSGLRSKKEEKDNNEHTPPSADSNADDECGYSDGNTGNRHRPPGPVADNKQVVVAFYTADDFDGIHADMPDFKKAAKAIGDVVVPIADPSQLPGEMDRIRREYGPPDRVYIIGHGNPREQRIGKARIPISIIRAIGDDLDWHAVVCLMGCEVGSETGTALPDWSKALPDDAQVVASKYPVHGYSTGRPFPHSPLDGAKSNGWVVGPGDDPSIPRMLKLRRNAADK